MQPSTIIEQICSTLPDVYPKPSWGETALFYNPGQRLPNGVYFCTLKEHDGQNDRASNLQRPGVFRLAIGLEPATYGRLFGPKPARPAKGGVIDVAYDFTALDQLMPHPIYGWMAWCQILSPSQTSWPLLEPLIHEAHQKAAKKFNRRTST